MRSLALFGLFILIVAGEARGQNAPARPQLQQLVQVADAAWSTVVTEFAQALAGNDPGAVAALLSDSANIHSFNGKMSDALRLMASARQCQLVSARAYVHVPPSVAGDVAEAFRQALVPEEVKVMMIPQDEAQLRRANATAALWLTDSLGARGGDRVAMIVLWSEEKIEGETNPVQRVVFVLLKGRTTDATAAIETIVFGTPQLF
jgi:hypothetical protein